MLHEHYSRKPAQLRHYSSTAQAPGITGVDQSLAGLARRAQGLHCRHQAHPSRRTSTLRRRAGPYRHNFGQPGARRSGPLQSKPGVRRSSTTKNWCHENPYCGSWWSSVARQPRPPITLARQPPPARLQSASGQLFARLVVQPRPGLLRTSGSAPKATDDDQDRELRER